MTEAQTHEHPLVNLDEPGGHVASRGPDRANPFVGRLASLVSLGDTEVDALKDISHNVRTVRADQVIFHQGTTTDYLCLVMEGLACRYKMLSSGRRQILGYLIPGDLCDANFTISNRIDHSLSALCDTRIAMVPIHKVVELRAAYPAIECALALTSLIDGAILREWLLNVGQRDAVHRLGHFLCEMDARMEAAGRIDDDGSFDLPINQVTLADTVGLTPVHTNRILQKLRRWNLIMLSHRRLKILDRPGLVALSGFDSNYLQLQGHRG